MYAGRNQTIFFCVLAAFQHGRQVSGPGLGQHPYGGETPRTSGGAAADAPEKSGEPHHWSAALHPPPTTLRCGPGVQRALLHHPWGALVEEKGYYTHTDPTKITNFCMSHLSCLKHSIVSHLKHTHMHTHIHIDTNIPACCINSVPQAFAVLSRV